MYILLYYIATPGSSLHLEFFCSMLYPWITVINPLVSIWINRPYRDAVKKLIYKIFKSNLANTIINPNVILPQ
jgi:hypothetical protein